MHVVVVLIPLAAIGMSGSVFSRNWARRYASVSVTLAGVAFASALLAKESGEEFLATASALPEHVSAGNTMPLYAFTFFALAFVFWIVDRGIPLNRPRPTWLKLCSFFVVLASVAATYAAVITGHSGALSVWG